MTSDPHFHDNSAPPVYGPLSIPYPGFPDFVDREDFGIELTGEILIWESGPVAFDCNSDDGFSLELDGVESGAGGEFTLIAAGNSNLPDDRNAGGQISVDITRFHEGVAFENGESYVAHRVVFPTLKDAATANSMQIAEVELLGIPVTGGALPLISDVRHTGITFEFRFTTEADAVYAVDYSTDLDDWSTVLDAVPGTGDPAAFADDDAACIGEEEAFYRVRRK